MSLPWQCDGDEDILKQSSWLAGLDAPGLTGNRRQAIMLRAFLFCLKKDATATTTCGAHVTHPDHYFIFYQHPPRVFV